MNTENELDIFGKFLVDHFRDEGINFAERLLKSEWKAEIFSELQTTLNQLTTNQKEAVKLAVIIALDSAMHDFLFALQDEHQNINHIQIVVNGKNVIDLSDGIHGEAFSDEGWYAKFSKYKTIL